MELQVEKQVVPFQGRECTGYEVCFDALQRGAAETMEV